MAQRKVKKTAVKPKRTPTKKAPAKVKRPRQKPGRKTASDKELRERHKTIAVALAKGKKKGELKNTYGVEWDINPRTMEDYIARAREILHEWWNFQIGADSRIDLVAQVAGTYAEVMHDGRQTAKDRVQAAEKMSKLFGLDAPFRVAPTTPEGDEPYKLAMADMTEEELLVILKIAEKAE